MPRIKLAYIFRTRSGGTVAAAGCNREVALKKIELVFGAGNVFSIATTSASGNATIVLVQ